MERRHTIKTGLEISTDLHRRVKAAAATRGLKFKEVTEQAFEAWLSRDVEQAPDSDTGQIPDRIDLQSAEIAQSLQYDSGPPPKEFISELRDIREILESIRATQVDYRLIENACRAALAADLAEQFEEVEAVEKARRQGARKRRSGSGRPRSAA